MDRFTTYLSFELGWGCMLRDVLGYEDQIPSYDAIFCVWIN